MHQIVFALVSYLVPNNLHKEMQVSSLLKRKSILIGALLSLALLYSSFLNVAADTSTAATENCPKKVKIEAEKLNDFSFRMLKDLIQEKDKNENVIISPIGLTSCISVLADGAKGQTQDQLLRALLVDKNLPTKGCSEVYKYITRPVPDVDLTFASSIYSPGNVIFDNSFKERFRTQFDGTMQTASSPDILGTQIVEWVKEKSKNMIILNAQDISPSGIGIINVLYFKGLWVDQFEPIKTKIETFKKSDNSSMDVDMMHQGFYSTRVLHGETADSQILELPYLSGENHRRAPFSMFIILPKSENPPEKILRELTTTKIDQRIADMKYKCGSLALPRFAISADSTFIPSLQKLGVHDAFTPQADFTGMTKATPAFVSEISQKLKLLVNERGTEASAFTQVVMSLGGLDEPHPFNFVVNRPFIVILRDNESKAILLMGIVRNPERDLESAQKIELEFSKKIEEAEKAYSQKPDESSIFPLQYSYTNARDYYVSRTDYKKAREYSNKIIALTKSSDSSSNASFRLDMDLSKHLEIEVKSGKDEAALETINQLLDLYFEEHSQSNRKRRQNDNWWDWQAILEQCDKHLISLNQDRTRILAAKESVLKESIRDRARSKEWHYGAWRRKLTTIGVPDSSSKIDFKQFINCYKNSLKILVKDIAAMQALQKNKKAFLQWHPTLQCSDYDDLGAQQYKLAKVYLEMKQPAKALPFLELSILNLFEDKNSESVSTNVATLIDVLKTLGRQSEANELSVTLNYCKKTSNSYIYLLKKWNHLQSVENEIYRTEINRQEHEDWQRESKNAK